MIIGIGIDIIEIDRIKESVNKFGDAFLNKIYTQNELDYCLAKFNKYQHLAARFAAKEAIYKALSVPAQSCKLENIEITNEKNGLPVVNFSGRLKDYLSTDKEIKISISHSDNYVACVALIYLK